MTKEANAALFGVFEYFLSVVVRFKANEKEMIWQSS